MLLKSITGSISPYFSFVPCTLIPTTKHVRKVAMVYLIIYIYIRVLHICGLIKCGLCCSIRTLYVEYIVASSHPAKIPIANASRHAARNPYTRSSNSVYIQLYDKHDSFCGDDRNIYIYIYRPRDRHHLVNIPILP